MSTEELIRLGISMGYSYDKSTQHPAALAIGRVSFDGFGDQRVTVYTASEYEITLQILAKGLIEYGKLQKIHEIKKVLQITN